MRRGFSRVLCYDSVCVCERNDVALYSSIIVKVFVWLYDFSPVLEFFIYIFILWFFVCLLSYFPIYYCILGIPIKRGL